MIEKRRRVAHNKINLVGATFGRLTVLSESEPRVYPSMTRTNWLCRCECGVEVEVLGCSLTTGNTLSCGCLQKKLVSLRSITHAMSGTPIYLRWQSMLNRCRNKDAEGYHNYGGRGIDVCDRWLDFDNFISDMGMPADGLTIERKDNNGNYTPNNCRWATRQEQGVNKRTNRVIEFNGERLCLIDWARRLGIDQASLRERLDKWPLARALTEKRRNATC